MLERLLLLRILPGRGSLTTLRIVRDLEHELSFSEEEHAALNFQVDEGATRWVSDAVGDKVIEFGPKAADIVYDVLEELNEKKALTMGMLNLCDKFGYGNDDDAAH